MTEVRRTRWQPSKVPVLAALPQADLEEVVRHLRSRRYPSRRKICPPAEIPGRLVIVISGTAGLMHSTATGSTCMVRAVSAGEVIDVTSLIRGTTLPGYVKACTAVTTLEVPAFQFRPLVDKLPALRQALTTLALEDAARTVQELCRQRIPAPVGRRVLRAILAHTGDDGLIPFTQADLGALVGASRQHVNRSMAPFIARGFITVSRQHRMRITNRAALHHAAGQTNP